MLVLYDFNEAFETLTGNDASQDKEGYRSFMEQFKFKFPFDVFINGKPVVYIVWDTDYKSVSSQWVYYDSDFDQYKENLEEQCYEEVFDVLSVFQTETKKIIGIL